MNPTYDLHGQVALVTGAGSGMGRDTVNAFATAGAAVVLADIDEDPLRAATDELTASGHRALGIACDLSDETQVAALVSARPRPSAGSTWPSTTPESRRRRPTPQTSRPRASTA